MTKTRRLLWS